MNRQSTRTTSLSTNADLIGIPGGRAQLDTPCLLVELDALKRNISLGAEMVHAAGKSFSPHLKAHKTPQIAALQKQAGASGFCVASIGEAEIFAAVSIGPLTITSAFATDRQIARIAGLAERGTVLTVVVDHSEIIDRLARLDVSLSVLVDIDMGRGRAGCRDERQAISLSKKVLSAKNLTLTGLQCYAGHLSHTNDFKKRHEDAAQADARAKSFLEAVGSVTSGPLRCSGGSTGSSLSDLNSSALTDLQWGSYAVMDVEYNSVENSADGEALPFENALRVASRVISTGHEDHVVMDAGDKRFASKYGAAPRVVCPACNADGDFRPVSDEHGELRGSMLPGLGCKIEVIPPHCDPTVNLFDVVHVVDGDTLVDIWPVAARGVY
ncbi:alanine racemase [Rhodobacteraceae bacterium]|nr:alanine racemase [Paracoccaceae bacterium]